MGTPEFAVPSLEALMASGVQVVAVVTNPDKPAGRDLRLAPSPVKVAAQAHGLQVLQPEDLNDPLFLADIASLQPDVGAVVAFRILPPALYGIPRLGCVNLHASFLPDLRGAAPINWALIRGMNKTGLTTFLIDRKVDTGNVLLQAETIITASDDCGSLSARMAEQGAALLVRTLDLYGAGRLQPVPQSGKHSLAPKLTPELSRLDWNQPARAIHNLVRGLSPHPAAHTTLMGKRIRLFKTSPRQGGVTKSPGVVIRVAAEDLIVATGEGSLAILEVQLEGRRRMTIGEFLRGHPVAVGTQLG